jgi:hypothetical protein
MKIKIKIKMKKTKKEQCKGDGKCLMQGRRVDEYIRNIDFTCVYYCRAKKCPNFYICQNIAPEWYFNCQDGVCLQCNLLAFSLFPKNEYYKHIMLRFQPIGECVFCYSICNCVKMMKCNHLACYSCFMKTYYNESNDSELISIIKHELFPYDDSVFDDWLKNQTSLLWKNNYPLISIWNEKNKIRNSSKVSWINKVSFENYTKCPICKK